MKKLNDKERFEILSLKEDDITKRKLAELFAATRQGDARFQTTDRFLLPVDAKLNNKTAHDTTVGKYIWNMFAIPKSYLNKFGYVTEEMNSGNLGDLESRMRDMILTKELKPEDYLEYLTKGEWLAGVMIPYISASYHWGSVDNISEIETLKNNLTKEYADKIAEGDKNTLSMIDDMLVKESQRIMKQNPDKYRTIDWAKAGVYNVNNNYKKTNIATGLQRRPGNENEYFYVGSNYAEGLEKKDFAKNSNLAIVGGLSRGLDSAEAGYSGKKILGAMSTWTVDKNKHDCGTNHLLDVFIKKGYETAYYYRWISDNNQMVMITPDNVYKYIDKNVKMRSPLYCKSEEVCQVCAGNFLERVGAEYEGLVAFEIADVLVNSTMKQFHNSSIKTTHINPGNYTKKID